MKLQEIERTQPATVAWGPSSYMALGTVAGTMNLDFDTSAHLEIVSLNLTSRTPEEKVLGKTSAPDRFHKLVWSQGTFQDAHPQGLIAGGLANGVIKIWDPAKIIAKSEDSLISTCEKHTAGPVQGLDFNPFQTQLLASGGADAEVYIWDLKNPAEPTVYNPGSKTGQQQDVPINCIGWNKKVAHILASTNYNGVTSIWDLKVKRAVLTFSDPNRRYRCRAMAWNPESGVQLITTSEDDSAPTIALWDLRNSYTPVKYLNGHVGGVWGVSWNPMDPDLLLSTGKDGKTLCWSVQDGTVLTNIDPSEGQWNYDIQWSPKIPAVCATTSLEGKVKLFSLQDVRNEGQTGLQGVQGSAVASQPPKWLKRPAGAVFSFTGKVFYFNARDAKKVKVADLVTDAPLVQRAHQLSQAINSDQLREFCEDKVVSAASEQERNTWALLKALLEQDQRHKIVEFLGYSPQDIEREFAKLSVKEASPPPQVEPVSEDEPQQEEESPLAKEKSAADLFGDSTEEFNIAPAKVPVEAKIAPKLTNLKFFAGEGVEGAITRALLVGNFEAAVEEALRANRLVDALVLAAYGGPELWAKAQDRYFASNPGPFTRIVSSIVKDDLRDLVETADLGDWKSVLALASTYASKDDFPVLAGYLGDRLDNKGDDASAILCYICAGNVDQTIQLWAKQMGKQDLSSLIELVSVYRKGLDARSPPSKILASKFSEYAASLATQGQGATALRSLQSFNTKALTPNSPALILIDRLYNSLPKSQLENMETPPFPFVREEIGTPARNVNAALPRSSPLASTAPLSTPFPGSAPNPMGSIPTFTPGRPAPVPAATPFTASKTSMGPPTGRPMGPPPTFTPVGPPPTFPGKSSVPPAMFTPPPTTSLGPPPTGFPSTAPPTATPLGPPPTAFPVGQAPGVGLPTTGPLPPSTFTPVTSAPPKPATVSAPPPTTFGPPPTTFAPPPTAFAPPPSTFAPPPSFTPASPAPVRAAPAPIPLGPPPGGNAAAAPLGPPPGGNPGNPASAPQPLKQEKKEEVPAKTTEENEFILESLNRIISEAVSSSDTRKNKIGKDVQPRFQPLLDKLKRNDVSAPLAKSLYELSQALNAGDVLAAQRTQATLNQDHWQELGGSLNIGVKRLVDLIKQ
eukprot:TRINITY_DN3700_c0_g1_i1.p1 TRINITY_DN3700_c0_g1~~TRINITY_DN3700_c0_g1_i1.p1  ORF type:complete len:1138 (+),score=363.18 TRINITY_DN3700_c0_g1_i1:134-3547(+)